MHNGSTDSLKDERSSGKGQGSGGKRGRGGMERDKWKKRGRWGLFFLLAALSLFFSDQLLQGIGAFLVVDEVPVASDVAVVLNTGIEIYPRLIEAARLYKQGYARKIVVNGNRKTDELRRLERQGFKPCCPWYEDSVRILRVLGVEREDVITISAEDAYDTMSEAKKVGEELLEMGVLSVILTTSKSHTRRARHIWMSQFAEQFAIRCVAAKDDPFSPERWFRDGRQIRMVLYEYGSWLFFFWQRVSLFISQ